MSRNTRSHPRGFLSASLPWVAALGVLALLSPVSDALAQQTGAISGRVADQQGNAISGAEVVIDAIRKGALTNASGNYVIADVPAGAHTVRVRFIGYRPQTAQVSVAPGGEATQDFTLGIDPLGLEDLVVTGTFTPMQKLESSVAISTLTSQDLELAQPRSTTEALRYIPGFTRVESSGGEVNQNISIRGILGVEFVLFMEDGLPVFPTMHTFFMNADNLFRVDENIERLEVVRGGTSALFGSNTPGAIVNFINKQGGPEMRGTLKATAGTDNDGLALGRYDFNLNGPLFEDWTFNVGGFYRYDHGVRDPGFPGVRGGQFKSSVTRQLDNGYFRASLKVINDRNQFILPLPFQNPDDPEYVPGFSDYGSMSTREGLNLRVPTPDGSLDLALDDGLRTQAYWLTADTRFDIGEGWTIQNSAQIMENEQGWNAILPFDVMPDTVWAPDQLANTYGLTDTTSYLFTFTNHFEPDGDAAAFNTANGLVSPGGLWHVEKPLTAFQNQLVVRKALDRHNLSMAFYFAHYTQENRWFFTDILMDVRDQPRFLDLAYLDGTTGDTIPLTENGFRKYVSLYRNASGHTTIFSGVLGGSFQLSDRLRADLGVRYEWNDFVQSTETEAPFDLDDDPTTPYDNVAWGSGRFLHFQRALDDVAASLALNYRLNERMALYGLVSRSYKMPALDEFLNASDQRAVDLFKPAENLTLETGVKFVSGQYGLAVNAFFTELRDIVSQGAETDPGTGAITWITRPGPETRAYGTEIEFNGTLAPGFKVLANATVLDTEFAACPDDPLNPGSTTCPTGADLGTSLNGVPPIIGNLAATYTTPTGLQLLADWHYVSRRYSAYTATGTRNELPTYSYLNLGAAYRIPSLGMTLTADVQNVYQSKGLEEGNPRLTSVGGRTSDVFLARPILPRRLLVSARYNF